MKPYTIYCDSRVGSKEFVPILKRLGTRALLYPNLPADFALIGCGPKKAEWKIGVERKTLGDLGSSLMKDRLFGTQLPRMLKEYDRIWLLIEGIFRCAPDGSDAIEVMGFDRKTGRKGWTTSHVPLTWSQMQGWLLTYDEMVGGKGKRVRTSTDWESASWLSCLNRWWRKPYEKHNGHISLEADTPMRSAAHALIHRPNDVQVVAFAFKGLGAQKAMKVGRYFKSVPEMVNASEKEWGKAGLTVNEAGKMREWLWGKR